MSNKYFDYTLLTNIGILKIHICCSGKTDLNYQFVYRVRNGIFKRRTTRYCKNQ